MTVEIKFTRERKIRGTFQVAGVTENRVMKIDVILVAYFLPPFPIGSMSIFMKINSIIITYILLTLAVITFLLFQHWSNSTLITLPVYYSYMFTVVYGLVLLSVYRSKILKFQTLALLIVFLGICGVYINNVVFYQLHNSFFASLSGDGPSYHKIATQMSLKGFSSFHSILPAKWNFDDMGFPFFLGGLYHVVNSNLLLNFVYIILHFFTCYFIYYIGLFFLTPKYSALSIITYGLSSYAIYFISSGLKEPLMIFFIYFSLACYYKYLASSKPFFLGMAILLAGFTLFFRVPIFFFLLLTYTFNFLFKYKKVENKIFIFGLFFSFFIFLFYSGYNYLTGYLRNLARLQHYSEAAFSSQINCKVIVTVIANGIFGPLPTLIPIDGKERMVIRGTSLVFKALLSGYFLSGCYLAIAKRNKYVIPALAFVSMQITGLMWVLQTMDLRKSMPHLPLVILISFHGVTNFYQFKNVFMKNLFIPLSSVCTALLVFLWNYLRFS